MELLAQSHRGSENIAFCFPIFLLAVVAIVILLVNLGWRSSFRQTLRSVATHLHGQVERGSSFHEYDRVQFEHDGQRAWLHFTSAGSNYRFTHVEIRWSGPRFRCEIYPEGFLASLRKLMGMQDIVIGSPAFDRAFIITGDDEPGIKMLLNAHVQTAIEHLSSYVSGMHIRIAPQSLTVTCKGLLSDFGRLVHFVNQCRELCDAALAAQGHGIEFLDGAPLTMMDGAPAEAHCMVCGEALVSEVVYCRRCKTPHHRECWSYCGGCSTYGCGEKKFATKN